MKQEKEKTYILGRFNEGYSFCKISRISELVKALSVKRYLPHAEGFSNPKICAWATSLTSTNWQDGNTFFSAIESQFDAKKFELVKEYTNHLIHLSSSPRKSQQCNYVLAEAQDQSHIQDSLLPSRCHFLWRISMQLPPPMFWKGSTTPASIKDFLNFYVTIKIYGSQFFVSRMRFSFIFAEH